MAQRSAVGDSRRVLAVGHDAYRAGAQIAFMHVLRWLRTHRDPDLRLVLGTGGALEPDYASVLPTTVVPPRAPSPPATRPGPVTRATRRLRPRRSAATAPTGIPDGGVDLVYANSVAAAHLASGFAAELGSALVLHVHELEMSIRRFTHANQIRDAFARVDRFIAVSGAVADNLVEHHGIASERIVQLPECIPIPTPVTDAPERARRRAEIGIPAEAFVVGGSGTVDWRKAPDVFVLVARAVQDARAAAGGRPVHFLWVGGEPRQLPMVEHDIVRLGLRDTTHFIGPRDDPQPWFELFDAFFLSSREDPYPLVCLEAAALGTPVVCYADGGGMPEFVEDDAGVVLPYLDIHATATCLGKLADSDPARAALGRRAADKVRERCAVDVVAPRISDVLDDALAARSPR